MSRRWVQRVCEWAYGGSVLAYGMPKGPYYVKQGTPGKMPVPRERFLVPADLLFFLRTSHLVSLSSITRHSQPFLGKLYTTIGTWIGKRCSCRVVLGLVARWARWARQLGRLGRPTY